jgi:hypothetical protein
MPAEVANATPRRARYLVPRSMPRRGEILAAAATLAVTAHLLFAQVTLLLAVVFYLTGKASRWRASWLAFPAAAGAAWALAIGPAKAVHGFTAGPAAVLQYLSTSGHLARIAGAFNGLGGWLPRQLPLAMLAGATEAAVATWLSWLHTDEQSRPPRRAGLVVAARRAMAIREIRSGLVSDPGSVSLGLIPGTGARVTVSWPELAGGMLVTGQDWAEVRATSLRVITAAVRLRKPVLAVDLAGDPAVASQLAAACAAAKVPLLVSGTACYEPFRHGDPAHRAALITAMLSRDGAASAHRPAAAAYLRDVLEVIDAAPGDPRVPVLDEILHLLDPAALRARMAYVPAGHARRPALGERTRLSVTLAAAEPAVVTELARQLGELRAGPAGRLLRPPAEQRGPVSPLREIDLGQITRERGAALFSLGPDAMLARLVCQDLLALTARLRDLSIGGDGLIWLAGCEHVPVSTLASMFTSGRDAGMPLLAATGSPAATELLSLPNVLLFHGTAATQAPGPGLSAGEFTLAVASPRRVVVRAVTAERRAAR